MHSHPRRRLPADRFPKLNTKMTGRNISVWFSLHGIHMLKCFPVNLWQAESAKSPINVCIFLSKHGSVKVRHRVALTGHHLLSASGGKHPPLENSTPMTSVCTVSPALRHRRHIKSSQDPRSIKENDSLMEMPNMSDPQLWVLGGMPPLWEKDSHLEKQERPFWFFSYYRRVTQISFVCSTFD